MAKTTSAVITAGNRMKKMKMRPRVKPMAWLARSIAGKDKGGRSALLAGSGASLADERDEAHGAVLGPVEAVARAPRHDEPLLAVANGRDDAPPVDELVDERARQVAVDGRGDVDGVVGRVLGRAPAAVADEQRHVGDARIFERV